MMITRFPPSFTDLGALYEGFCPVFEMRRKSFEEFTADLLRQAPASKIESELQTESATAREIKTHLKQRHFYRSATCFYRSFDLFLAYIALQGQMFGTWSEITGYYSRFYFIQALLNLLQANWFELPNHTRILVYHTGTSVCLLDGEATRRSVGARRGSHQVWWKIFACLGQLDGYPRFETFRFCFGRRILQPSTQK